MTLNYITALQLASVNYYFPGTNCQKLTISSDGWFTILHLWLAIFPSCPAGELFAQAPVKEYPGTTVETVSDSSRYFVLRIQDDNGEDVNIKTMTINF